MTMSGFITPATAMKCTRFDKLNAKPGDTKTAHQGPAHQLLVQRLKAPTLPDNQGGLGLKRALSNNNPMITQTTAAIISPMASCAIGLVVTSEAPSGLNMNSAPNKHAHIAIRPTNPICRSHAFLRRFSTSRLSSCAMSASAAALGFNHVKNRRLVPKPTKALGLNRVYANCNLAHLPAPPPRC
jgi:hypothetical protein